MYYRSWMLGQFHTLVMFQTRAFNGNTNLSITIKQDVYVLKLCDVSKNLWSCIKVVKNRCELSTFVLPQ